MSPDVLPVGGRTQVGAAADALVPVATGNGYGYGFGRVSAYR
ncbi:hypothetical protein ACIGXA_21930 [Streptomyces fildesensis]|uniref:Uncharacterized protein n=1 Tax=Streptomyces fildesensis TaxID=375757 RepID=A0ABW8CCS8_9ACTN